MSFWISLLVFGVFFAAVGAFLAVTVSRSVLRETSNSAIRLQIVWLDSLPFVVAFLVLDVMQFFAPKRPEDYTTIFVVCLLLQEGKLSEDQAKHYLHSKGIEVAL